MTFVPCNQSTVTMKLNKLSYWHELRYNVQGQTPFYAILRVSTYVLTRHNLKENICFACTAERKMLLFQCSYLLFCA